MVVFLIGVGAEPVVGFNRIKDTTRRMFRTAVANRARAVAAASSGDTAVVILLIVEYYGRAVGFARSSEISSLSSLSG